MRKLITCMYALCVTGLFAQGGALDITFNLDGMVTSPVGPSNDFGTAAAIQPDGKIVVGGYSNVNSNFRFSMARYNTDGSLDNTFDSDGVKLDSLLDQNQMYDITIQPDGKIVAVGTISDMIDLDMVVLRYNSNGSPDTSFDGDGVVLINTGGFEEANSVAIQTDGKILVGGYAGSGDVNFLFMRFNTNGSLDTTFDSDGMVTYGSPSTFDVGKALLIQPDGKIVQVGQNGLSSGEFMIVRINTNGSIDSTFDADGITLTDVGTVSDIATGVAIQMDGKLLVCGNTNNVSNNDIAVVRYNTNGSLDNSFDIDGIVVTPVGNDNDQASGVVVQSDGKILVGGSSATSYYNFVLLRYNSNGSIDSSFDSDGIVITDFGTNSMADAIAMQSDGKIILAGSFFGANYDFAVARYLEDSVTTGLPNYSLLDKIEVYPNPVIDQLQMTDPYQITLDVVYIYNEIGELIKAVNVHDANTIQVGFLHPGIYFLKICSGDDYVVKRIIKQ